jgi:predicted DNA-binding transcriptional regulator AlpA
MAVTPLCAALLAEAAKLISPDKPEHRAFFELLKQVVAEQPAIDPVVPLAPSPVATPIVAPQQLPRSPPKRIIRMKELCARLSRCETSVRQDIAAGRLPRPFPLGPRAIGFDGDAVDAAIEAMCADQPVIYVPKKPQPTNGKDDDNE